MCRTWASLQCTTYADKIIVFYVLGANQGAHNTRRVRVYGLRPTRKRLQGQLELRPSSVVPRTQSTTDKFTSSGIRGSDVCEVSRLPKSERTRLSFTQTRSRIKSLQNNAHTWTVKKCITKSYLIRLGAVEYPSETPVTPSSGSLLSCSGRPLVPGLSSCPVARASAPPMAAASKMRSKSPTPPR